jgi:flagellar biosynthesis protein FlhG
MRMNWNETRQKLLRLTPGGHGLPVGPDRPFSTAVGVRSPPGPEARASSLCIASGKGGTGKSVVSASLGTLFSEVGRTLILDADLGVGNAHILQDVSPAASLVEVVEGTSSVRDVLVSCTRDLDLIAAGSGVPRMAELTRCELDLVAAGIEELEAEYRYVLVDSAAGVSRQTLAFAQACDLVCLVTTGDLTAMTDAYAMLKLLHRTSQRGEAANGDGVAPFLVVNRARGAAEAEDVFQRISRVSERFLGLAPVYAGFVPEDPIVATCVNRRGSVLRLEPGTPFARAIEELGTLLLGELARRPACGLGRRLAVGAELVSRLA